LLSFVTGTGTGKYVGGSRKLLRRSSNLSRPLAV
jgi:hypothetical protein